MDWIASNYLWIKAFHIIAVISWMAGLLYLPRLFVYHTKAEPGGVQSETFKIMERRLLNAIMTPAMLVAWGLGLALLAVPGVVDWTSDFWMHGKAALVLAMTGMHVFFAVCTRRFAQDKNRFSSGLYRALNEVPTLLMVAIVIFVVVKPF
ncbi:MAG: protoporphyrinogen oxidase HemJ [Alphaproteobacteria bacterium]